MGLKGLGKYRTFIAVLLLCLVSVKVVMSIPVWAAPVLSNGLTVSPLRKEFNINPGTSQDGTLTISNSSEKTITVSLSAEEFSVVNQKYDYAFTSESDFVNWVLFDDREVILNGKETKKVNYKINVPLTAEPGGRYLSMFASTKTKIDSSQESSSLQRVASLLYVTVLGDVTRSGNLLSITSPWLVGDSGDWSAVLQNTGTTHFYSRYNVVVNNLIGNEVINSMSGSAMILPGTVRLVTDKLPLPRFFGIYRYVYTVGLGDTPATVRTAYFIYSPPQLILILALSVICFYIVNQKKKRLEVN